MNGCAINKKGLMIVFEGLDKSGKSTQCKLLQEYFTKNQQQSFVQSFPDRSTVTGAILNDYLSKKIIPGAVNSPWDISSGDHTIHLLFSANRWEKRPLLMDKLNKGVHVIIDRYAFSGVAFTAAKGYDIQWCKMCDQGLPKPDIIFYLNGSVESLNQRDNFGSEIYENVSFQCKVGDIYKHFETCNLNWIVIDANRDPTTIHNDILSHVHNTPSITKSMTDILCDFTDVIDLSIHDPLLDKDSTLYQIIRMVQCENIENDNKSMFSDLFVEPTMWKIYAFKSNPGLYVIRDALRPISQYYFTMKALTKYCQYPFWNNYNCHNYNIDLKNGRTPLLPLNGNIWDAAQRIYSINSDVYHSVFDLHKKYLRWAQQGYLFHHDTHTYDAEPNIPLCPELKYLARYVAKTLHLCGCDLFEPDSVLINYYAGCSQLVPKTKCTVLRPHTDIYEQSMNFPIVALSTGLSAIFLVGTDNPNDEPKSILLRSGDICVMSGPSRIAYHAVPKIITDGHFTPNDLSLCVNELPSFVTQDEKDVFLQYSNDLCMYMNEFRINFSIRQYLS